MRQMLLLGERWINCQFSSAVKLLMDPSWSPNNRRTKYGVGGLQRGDCVRIGRLTCDR